MLYGSLRIERSKETKGRNVKGRNHQFVSEGSQQSESGGGKPAVFLKYEKSEKPFNKGGLEETERHRCGKHGIDQGLGKEGPPQTPKQCRAVKKRFQELWLRGTRGKRS